MEFGGASQRSGIQFATVFTVLSLLAQINALAQDSPVTAAANSPVSLNNSDICTVQGLPVPDPLDEQSVTMSVLAVMGDVPPPVPIYDDRRANDCCILITPPDYEYRISIAARLAVEARFLRGKDENAVRHLYQLIEFCEDEITQAAFLSAYGGPLPGDGSTEVTVEDGIDPGSGGGPPNPSAN
jgi:hypothetical protein